MNRLSRTIVLALAFSCAVAGQAYAKKQLVARLKPAQVKQLTTALMTRQPVGPLLSAYIPMFKVPAIPNLTIVCYVVFRGLECVTEDKMSMCPKEVEVRIEGAASPAKVPVKCFGPDPEGMCECDFDS